MTPSEKTRARNGECRVLVTGASGKIGKRLLEELVARGYSVRALTTKPVAANAASPVAVEWIQFDFHQSTNFEPLVEGCSAVLHLGAELRRIEKMKRSNVEATRLLARAAEAKGVKFFCYVSSVAVYGSSLKTDVTEDSPVLTIDRDVKGEYLAEDILRAYGRTKLAGEFTIREEARNVCYVILRPTVVVEVEDLAPLSTWNPIKRAIAGYRHTQHIFIFDVVHAILWFMEQSLANSLVQPSITVYNLADSSVEENTYVYFFRKAYLRTSDPRFKSIELPWVFDGLRDALKFRTLLIRHTLGRMRFSTNRLHATGYQHRYGVEDLYDRALTKLGKQTTDGG